MINQHDVVHNHQTHYNTRIPQYLPFWPSCIFICPQMFRVFCPKNSAKDLWFLWCVKNPLRFFAVVDNFANRFSFPFTVIIIVYCAVLSYCNSCANMERESQFEWWNSSINPHFAALLVHRRICLCWCLKDWQKKNTYNHNANYGFICLNVETRSAFFNVSLRCDFWTVLGNLDFTLLM